MPPKTREYKCYIGVVMAKNACRQSKAVADRCPRAPIVAYYSNCFGKGDSRDIILFIKELYKALIYKVACFGFRIDKVDLLYYSVGS